MKQNSGLAHCVHHDIHWEYCYNYQKRVEFIKENKPKEEQELRLKLFKLLPNKLVPGRKSAEWKACIKAGKSYNKALQSCIMAREAYDKALQSCIMAREAYDKAEELYYDLTEETYRGGSAYIKAKEVYCEAKEVYCEARGVYCEAKESRIMAWEAYLEAWKAYKKARKANDEAWDAYFSKYAEELQTLHNKMFPDCTWNGKTIFGEEY